MPRPPGSGVTSSARRNRIRSIDWLSPVDVPSRERDGARLWSSRRQSQRVCICADNKGLFAQCAVFEISAVLLILCWRTKHSLVDQTAIIVSDLTRAPERRGGDHVVEE
jgi:hypothetical protein